MFDKREWRELAEATLCRSITVNARRVGEPPALTLEEWQDALDDKWKKKEVLSVLNEAERHLADHRKVVYITGKQQGMVPILGSVIKSNKCLFARQLQDSLNHLDGWQMVNSVASRASLLKPELVTYTRLRKELATTLQLLDMNAAELTWVSNHLGHSVNVHKQWCQQEESTIEQTKVAKVLIAEDDRITSLNKRMTGTTEQMEGNS